MDSTETSRIEELLKAILGMEAKLEPPQSRIEVLIWAILESGGGGGGGTTNYNLLSNLPKINNVELKGNKTLEQLGLQPELTFDNVPTSGSNNPVKSGGIYTALAGKVDKVAGKDLSTNDYTTAEKQKLAGIETGAEVNIIERITVNGVEMIPADKTVALTVLTNAVDSLLNYYKKSETYTKEEVNDLVDTIISLTLEIVETLPTEDISTTTIYLVPVAGSTNVYMQYAYIGGAWAQLGTTEVDLTNYYTKTQVDALLDTKEDLLTFDAVPTAGSDNPVTSGGIANALNGKQDTLTFDTEPTENSTNPVESGGVYDAIKNASSVFIGTASEWESESAKSDFQIAIITDQPTVNAVDSTDGSTTVVGEPNKRWVGTKNEWEQFKTDYPDKAAKYEIVCFTDDNGASGKDIYSTTETKTNKVWINGKPIYRKVFTDIPLPEEADIVQADRRTTKKYTSVFPANYISDIVSASFVIINRTYGNQYNLPRIWESSEPDTSESMIVSIDANIISEGETFGYSFEIGSNRTSWNNTNYKVRAIVEYTKAGD